jgi:transcriptional regulator with GAF, ATPase, and Fis domain
MSSSTRSPTDFNLGDFYTALDSLRRARGLSWPGAMREINRQSERQSTHPVSVSTVTGLRTKAVAEADGVLQMLLWLNRTPESFLPEHSTSDNVRERLPEVSPHQVLRFDTRKLHAALDEQRRARNMTWAQVARELGLGVSSLTHLSKGGRTGFPHVMRIVRWLKRPAAEFTRISDW